MDSDGRVLMAKTAVRAEGADRHTDKGDTYLSLSVSIHLGLLP